MGLAMVDHALAPHEPLEPETPEQRKLRQGNTLLQYFCGEQLYLRLKELAKQRQENVIEMVMVGIDRAIEFGGFEIDQTPPDRRTGLDEQHGIPVNRRMQELLTTERYHRVLDRARDRKVSNVTMLKFGVEAALNRGMF